MKLTRNTVSGVLYATLMMASASAPALTLGKLRGVALLGKELDISVTVQFASDEDISSTCFAAEVSYGNTPVESSRLVLSAQAGAQPNTKIVRISSSARVEDAVVTVDLKTTCGPKAVRRYVLLSDFASDVVSSASNTVAGSPVEAVPALKAPVSASTAGTAVVGQAASRTNANVVAPRRVKPSAQKAPSTLPTIATATEAGGKPVAASNEVLEDLHRRVESIEKWQSQTSAADDLIKSDARVKAFEADINGLKAITAKNQANLQTVAAALEASESENYGRTLLYALGALLAVCVAAVGFVVSRVRGGGDAAPWWLGGDGRAEHKNQARQDAPADAVDTVDSNAASILEAEEAAGASEPPMPVAGSITNVDIDLDGGPDPEKNHSFASMLPPQSKAGAPDFANSGLGQIRTVNTKEMLDIRQQAEFFMALGQHDDAVQLLEGSIQGNSEANPLVFLDLLKIFHTLSRREDFERYREEFNTHFTGRVLPYAEFLVEGNGLDAYEDICQQIVVLWPTEYTIDFIEQCLVRTPEDDPEQGIDLEAFRDLLLLYGVLKRLDQTADSGLIPFSTTRTSNTQMTVLPDTQSDAKAISFEEESAPLPSLSQSPDQHAAPEVPSLRMDLDLDLSGDGAAPLSVPGNLIDFDMSAFVKPEAGKDLK